MFYCVILLSLWIQCVIMSEIKCIPLSLYISSTRIGTGNYPPVSINYIIIFIIITEQTSSIRGMMQSPNLTKIVNPSMYIPIFVTSNFFSKFLHLLRLAYNFILFINKNKIS